MLEVLPLWKPKRCNCLVWALYHYFKYGGYIAFRKSQHTPLIPHFFWSRDGKHWMDYYPIAPKSKLLPPPLFRGAIREGLD